MSSRLAYTTIYIIIVDQSVLSSGKNASLMGKCVCVGCGVGKRGAEMLTIFSFLRFSLLNILSLLCNSLHFFIFSFIHSFNLSPVRSFVRLFVCLSVHSIAFSSMIFILFLFFFLVPFGCQCKVHTTRSTFSLLARGEYFLFK